MPADIWILFEQPSSLYMGTGNSYLYTVHLIFQQLFRKKFENKKSDLSQNININKSGFLILAKKVKLLCYVHQEPFKTSMSFSLEFKL